MSNTIITPTQVTRKALSILHNKLTFIGSINRQYDDSFAKTGAKIGSALRIREPNKFTVRTGATMDTQDITETYQTLSMATQMGVDINFSSAELTLSLDDFAERILEPAMARLAAEVEYTVLSAVYKDIYNLTGASGMATTPGTLACVLNAGVKISQGLAPLDNRSVLMDSPAMAGTVAALAQYFHKASEVEKAFSEGYIGYAGGFKWRESNMTPSHTNGTRTDTTPVTTIGGTTTEPSGGIVSGTATIVMTAFADGTTYKAGDIFTVDDVYAVNPETKQRYPHLQQWVVTADETETGTGDMSPAVSPTPYTSGVNQNIEIASTGAKAVLNLTGGGSGAASAVNVQDLAYHKDAFTFVSADLEVPKGVDFAAREVYEGISLRIVRNFDIVNDKFPCRIDVLFGYKTIRPEWATRFRG